MKKVMLAVVLVVAALGVAYAATDLTNEDYEYLDRLHNKLVVMKRHVDRLMKDIVSTYPSGADMLRDFGEDIKVDIAQDDKNIIVRADLPGMEKDRIDIALEKNKILRISGRRESEKKEAAPGIVKQERILGKFERVVELPCEGMNEGITATYKNGVLEVVIPKKKEPKAERVKISVI
jgi:HSP20 family protein